MRWIDSVATEKAGRKASEMGMMSDPYGPNGLGWIRATLVPTEAGNGVSRSNAQRGPLYG